MRTLLATFIIFIIAFSANTYAEGFIHSIGPIVSSISEGSALTLDLTQYQTEESCPDEADEHPKFNEREKSPSNKTIALATVAAAPIAYLMTNALHEGVHCSVAEAVGYDCEEIRLIPYYDREKSFFYLASATYHKPIELADTPHRDALVIAAPMMVNGTLISLYSVLAFTDSLPKNRWAKAATLLFGTMQMVDLATHLSNRSIVSDSGKVIDYLQRHRGMSESGAFWTVKGAQAGFLALGASAVILEGSRLFSNGPTSSSSEQQSQRSFSLVPQFSSAIAGVSLSGEF